MESIPLRGGTVSGSCSQRDSVAQTGGQGRSPRLQSCSLSNRPLDLDISNLERNSSEYIYKVTSTKSYKKTYREVSGHSSPCLLSPNPRKGDALANNAGCVFQELLLQLEEQYSLPCFNTNSGRLHAMLHGDLSVKHPCQRGIPSFPSVGHTVFCRTLAGP